MKCIQKHAKLRPRTKPSHYESSHEVGSSPEPVHRLATDFHSGVGCNNGVYLHWHRHEQSPS